MSEWLVTRKSSVRVQTMMKPSDPLGMETLYEL